METYQVENFEIENKQLKHAHNNFCEEIMNSKRQENWRNVDLKSVRVYQPGPSCLIGG